MIAEIDILLAIRTFTNHSIISSRGSSQRRSARIFYRFKMDETSSQSCRIALSLPLDEIRGVAYDPRGSTFRPTPLVAYRYAKAPPSPFFSGTPGIFRTSGLSIVSFFERHLGERLDLLLVRVERLEDFPGDSVDASPSRRSLQRSQRLTFPSISDTLTPYRTERQAWRLCCSLLCSADLLLFTCHQGGIYEK